MATTNVIVHTPDGPQVFPGVTPETRNTAITALNSRLTKLAARLSKPAEKKNGQ